MSPVVLVILAQVIFLILGIYYLEFEIKPWEIIIVLATAIITETAFAYFWQKKIYFPNSAIAAALGLAIFLRTDQIWIYILAAFLAIASKFVVKINGKHIFNPSNFGILAVVYLFTSDATIDLTHWGSNPLIFLLISGVALLVAVRAKVIITTISFLFSYLILLLLTLPFIPNIVSVHHFGLIGPSLVIFASFMITDPKTSPTQTKLRIVHGITVAILYFILEIIGIRYSLFLASFLTSLGNIIGRGLTGALSNVLVLAVFSLTLTFLFLKILITTKPQFALHSISPRFIALGVESNELLSCPKGKFFKDVTAQAGLQLKARNQGAAFGDFNNDGWDDLFVSNTLQSSRLYRNNGDGTFTDITKLANLENNGSSAAFFVDYDNDGYLDLFIAYPLTVWRNQRNGSFTDVTTELGLRDFPDLSGPPNLSTASFADFNNDGFLDLVLMTRQSIKFLFDTKVPLRKSLSDPFFNQGATTICHPEKIAEILAKNSLFKDFVEQNLPEFFKAKGCISMASSLQLDSQGQTITGDTSADISVGFYIPAQVFLFQNIEGKKFSEIESFRKLHQQILDKTLSAKNVEPHHHRQKYDLISGRHFQPISFDYDGDGLIDIFIAIDSGANLLLKNLGNFQFQDVTIQANLNYSGTGMGVAVADVDGNDYFDLVVSNVLDDFLFLGSKSGTFTLSQPELAKLGIGWGIAFLDYNLDGQEDLFIVNGDMARVTTSKESNLNRPLFRSDKLYQGLGNGRFIDTTGIDICNDAESGRALAVSDYDGDGDPDLFVGNIDFSPELPSQGNTLYRNSTFNRHYIKINLKGRQSNSFGVGAIVKVSAGNSTQSKLVTAGGSFFSQNSYTLIFGLGQNTQPVTVDVIWPSGKISHLDNVRLNQTLVVKE